MGPTDGRSADESRSDPEDSGRQDPQEPAVDGAGSADEAPPVIAVASRSGAVRIVATEQGLPLRVDVEPEQLDRDPGVLARELLRLCRQAAQRAGLQRRIQMRERGVPDEVIDRFGYPHPADVARDEIADDEDEYEPTSWMRPL